MFLRLKSQDGAWHIARATVGGHGVRDLQPFSCTVAGYTVHSLKEEARSSLCYVVPLNSDLDMSPLQVNDVTLSEPQPMCKCGEMVNLSEFKDHKANCSSGNIFSLVFIHTVSILSPLKYGILGGLIEMQGY